MKEELYTQQYRRFVEQLHGLRARIFKGMLLLVLTARSSLTETETEDITVVRAIEIVVSHADAQVNISVVNIQMNSRDIQTTAFSLHLRASILKKHQQHRFMAKLK